MAIFRIIAKPENDILSYYGLIIENIAFILLVAYWAYGGKLWSMSVLSRSQRAQLSTVGLPDPAINAAPALS